jgi:phosphoserine phosphatase
MPDSVVTLIADPARPALDHALLVQARAALPRVSASRWLAPGIAADVMFAADARDTKAIETELRAALNGAPLDIVLQPAEGRRKRLLVADMESTIIGQECLDELAESVGLRDRIAAITERAMRGEIDFEPALRERIGLLKGLAREALQHVMDERVRPNPGARTLVRTMRAHGAFTALVSGGFTFFTEQVARMLGFDTHQANRLVFDGDRLAGAVAEPILGRDAKLAALERLAHEHGVALSESLAVGDGANDLAMLRRAGLGVAYRAKPKVAAEAAARIDHGDLTALLYLQGYGRDEFADDP